MQQMGLSPRGTLPTHLEPIGAVANAGASVVVVVVVVL